MTIVDVDDRRETAPRAGDASSPESGRPGPRERDPGAHRSTGRAPGSRQVLATPCRAALISASVSELCSGKRIVVETERIGSLGGKPGASSKRGNKQKSKAGSRSGNPAKRAAENAGIAAAPAAPTGSGFGLGGANAQPSEADLAEIQKLFGKN